MKRVLSVITILAAVMGTVNAGYALEQQPYSYILPVEYTDIETENHGNVIIAADKSGNYAVYNYDGVKVSEDYDRINQFEYDVTRAVRDGVNYFINYQGTVVGSTDKTVLYYNADNVLVDLSDNPIDAPIHYYDGEFGVCDFGGEIKAVFPYNGFKPSRTDTSGFFISRGLMIFKDENYKYGAVDVFGKTVIEPQYDLIYPFSEYMGVAVAAKDGKYGLINSDGVEVTEFVYDYIEPVFSGYAFNGYFTEIYEKEPVAGYRTEKDGKYGLLDETGNKILDTIYDLKPYKLFDTYSLVLVGTENVSGDPAVYGIMDFGGNMVVTAEHKQIYNVTEGIIPAKRSDNICGFYDLYGNQITEFIYKSVTPFSEGLATVTRETENGVLHEVINTKGEVIFGSDNENTIGTFRNGISRIGTGERFVDAKGNTIIENTVWKSASAFQNRYSGYDISIVSDGVYSGVIRYNRPETEPVWDYEYIDFGNMKSVEKTEDGYIYKTVTDEEIYLDSYGNITEYIPENENMNIETESEKLNSDKIKSLKENTGIDKNDVVYLGEDIFKKGNSVIDINGKVLAAECYYITEMGDNGYIGISMPGFEGYIDKTGRSVLTLSEGYCVQGRFSEGMASVVRGIVYGRYGNVSYINEKGEIVLSGENQSWCMGGEFKNGVALMRTHLGRGSAQGSILVRCTYDTPSGWAKDTVEKAIRLKLVPLNRQNRYRKNITRESFCEIAYELPVIREYAEKDSIMSSEFSDTDNSKIKALASIGIIEGVGDGKFAPYEFITREQAAVILDRIYALSEKSIPDGDDTVFSDDDLISSWARDGVYNMRKTGVIEGVGNGEFAPLDTYTTEQAITTIYRLFNEKL